MDSLEDARCVQGLRVTTLSIFLTSEDIFSYSTSWFLVLLEKKESFRQQNEGGYFCGGSAHISHP
jgi:hypothetical protein